MDVGWGIVAGEVTRGSIKLTALFNDPSDPEQLVFLTLPDLRGGTSTLCFLLRSSLPQIQGTSARTNGSRLVTYVMGLIAYKTLYEFTAITKVENWPTRVNACNRDVTTPTLRTDRQLHSLH